MSGGRLERAALARLADADAAIPDLALAIDEHALARALSRARPDLDVRRIERRYTRYKPATSCLSLFEIELGDGGATTHSVKAYGDAVADKAERVAVDGASVFAVGERAIVSRFPHDAKLPSLAALLDPAARGGVLASALGDGDRWGATTLAPLAYKPERRFVARVENANGERVALKLHASQRHRDASRKLISLASRDGLRLPERLVSSHGDGLVATTWLEGELASDAIARASFDPRALGRVGRALAVLQRQDPKHVPVVRPRERAAALLAMPDALAALDGPLAERARRLAERLAARIASTPADAVPVHGDFYAKQVLLGDDDVSFLDLDAAARGGEAQDAGCFAAHLDRDVVRGRLPLPRAEAARAALLEGLSLELGRGVDARLEHAVALFSLLADPFRRNEEEWLEQTRELLEFAREIEARLPTVAAAASGARRALRRRAAAPAPAAPAARRRARAPASSIPRCPRSMPRSTPRSPRPRSRPRPSRTATSRSSARHSCATSPVGARSSTTSSRCATRPPARRCSCARSASCATSAPTSPRTASQASSRAAASTGATASACRARSASFPTSRCGCRRSRTARVPTRS
ncbi:MAG: hypothetical protein R3E88_12430 [Myxococcota bacterium]